MGQLEDMNVFIRIVEAGGISRAADQMGIAKSAISRRLVALETRLGVRLLNRTTRTSSLTEAGQSYYERAIKLIDDVAELNAITTDSRCALAGTIRLAVPLSFGLAHLSPAISIFAKEHPELTINIDFSDRQIDLVEEGFDLAFRITDLKDSTLVARKISPIRLILCASPNYIEKYGMPRTLGEIKNHRFLHYNVSGSSSLKLKDKKGKEHLVKLSAKMIANNGDFLRDMAITGHGILATPTFISWKALATGDLVPVLADFTLPQRNAYAVYPQTRYLSQRARALIDFLVERFGDNPYWDQNISASSRCADKIGIITK